MKHKISINDLDGVDTLHEDRIVYRNINGNLRTISAWEILEVYQDPTDFGGTTIIKIESANRQGYIRRKSVESPFNIQIKIEKAKNRHFLSHNEPPPTYFRLLSGYEL